MKKTGFRGEGSGVNQFGPKVLLRILLSLVFTTPYTLLYPLPCRAAAGRATANYLKVDAGGKAAAMGGTQFGAEGDSFAPFYNPALLSKISQKEIGFMRNEFFSDFKQNLLTYAHPTSRFGTVSCAVSQFSYGKIDGYDARGVPMGGISAEDLLIGAGWAKNWNFSQKSALAFLDSAATGISVKALKKTLHHSSASGFALDAGFSYPFQGKYVRGVRIAGAIQNWGPGLKFKSETAPLPTAVRLGLACSFFGSALTVAADGILPLNESVYPVFGGEYRILKMFALRAGYKQNKWLDKNYSFGIGFENPRFRIDYAFVPFGDLGETHRVSAQFRFGKEARKPELIGQLQEKVHAAKTLYAQGQLVESYFLAFQVQKIVPWLAENNKLIAAIQKDFKELEDIQRKAELTMKVEAIFSRAEKFYEEGNLLNAHLEFQAILGLQPENKAAQGYVKQIEGQFKSFVESFYREGMAAFAAGNYERAKEEFEKVLVISPDHPEAKAQLAKCSEILEKKQQEAAVAAQQSALVKTRAEAMDAYMKEEYEESMNLFRKILNVDPKNDEAQRYLSLSRKSLFKGYLEKGQKSAAKGEWEPAIKNLKEAVDINPDSHEARSALDDAKRRWELQGKVLSQNLYKEGLEAFLSGDKKKAKAAWQRAVDLDPDNEEAKRGLSRIAP